MSGAAIYANNANAGPVYIYVLDPNTFAVTDTVFLFSGSNGKGVVDVGDTVYYTTAESPYLYSYTISTKTDHGALFKVAGASGLSSLAFDGAEFYVGDYGLTNHVYVYTPTGTLLKTLALADCSTYCDGLEFFIDGSGNRRLIANEGGGHTPGIYDVYDTDGNLITHDFIDTGSLDGSGIAYDGTDFFVSNYREETISVYDNTGKLLRTQLITGAPGIYYPRVQGLSADDSVVLPPNAPEPATLTTLGAGLLCCWWVAKRRLG